MRTCTWKLNNRLFKSLDKLGDKLSLKGVTCAYWYFDYVRQKECSIHLVALVVDTVTTRPLKYGIFEIMS